MSNRKNLNTEHRDSTRFPHVSPITIELLDIGVLKGARMLNYSDVGLYFESDHDLQPGLKLYIGIKRSPFVEKPNVYECYHAQIKWRKPLKRSYYNYGYGAELFGIKSRDMQQSAAESRRNPRKSCSIPINFACQDEIYQGTITDISLGGVFVNSDTPIHVDDLVTVTIPTKKAGKVVQRRGKVVWSNEIGFGIKFQK